MDGTERATFDEFPNFILKDTATRISQGLRARPQYLNAMRKFSYDANEKRCPWKSSDEERLESALEEKNTFFFPSDKNWLVTVLTIHKTPSGGPSLGARRYRRPLLSVQHPLQFRLLPLRSFLYQLFQHQWPLRRRGHNGDRNRGCSRPSYLMLLPPTLNGLKVSPRDSTDCGVHAQLSAASRCS